MLITQIRNSLLTLFVIGFFFFPQLQTIIIAACFVTLLVDKTYYDQFSIVLKNKLGLAMIGYFLVLAISVLYSQNVPEGLRSLETKLSFFVFPFFLPVVFHNRNITKRMLTVLLYAGVSYIFLSLIDAAIHYQSTRSISSFFYTELGVGFFRESSFVHPTYASFFYNVLIAHVALGLLQNEGDSKKKIRGIGVLILLVLFVFMLSSKFGILALLLNLCFLLFFYIKKTKKVAKAAVVLVLFTLGASLVVTQTPLKHRFESAFSALTSGSGKYSSTQTRLDVWNVTAEVIAEHPILGVGTGDVRDELRMKYMENEYFMYAERGYDSHQEFLQTWAALGLLGVLLLLSLFYFLFHRAKQTRHFLLTIFTILFLLFGLVESMLERQAGVVFFVFFGLLLHSYSPLKNNN